MNKMVHYFYTKKNRVSSYNSTFNFYFFMRHQAPAGIEPPGWDDPKVICDWEVHSLTTRSPQTGERANQQASGLFLQTFYKLGEENDKYKQYKQFKVNT